MTTAPRDDLIRGVTPMRAEDDGKTMVGYPIVYNQWTEIHSWEGDFLERVRPGAANQSIRQRRDQIKVQYNHGMHPTIGTSGLGKPKVIRSESKGVYTETPLSDTSYNRDIIIPQLRDGTLDGMSFRFSVVKEEWADPKRAADHNPDKLPERSIVELKLYEFGPVDWPAYEATQAGVRSQARLEQWLSAPPEQRATAMDLLGVTVGERNRLYVPGFNVSRDTAATTDEGSEPPPTGTSDDAEPPTTGTSEFQHRKFRRKREKADALLAAGRKVRGESNA